MFKNQNQYEILFVDMHGQFLQIFVARFPWQLLVLITIIKILSCLAQYGKNRSIKLLHTK